MSFGRSHLWFCLDYIQCLRSGRLLGLCGSFVSCMQGKKLFNLSRAEDPALGTEVLRQADAHLRDVPRWKG